MSVVTTTDDAGITVHKRVLPSPPIPGSYSLRLQRLPTLSAICINILALYTDQLHLTQRLPFRSEVTRISLCHLDPRLWSALVQIYDALPNSCRVYNIPLNDTHLPLLQRVSSTSQFSLITILDLPACQHITDDSIPALNLLHSLVAFDASATVLSSYAVKVLARTLVLDPSRRGPWGLRILRLRNCSNIDNSVSSYIDLFPLLSVLGASSTLTHTFPSLISFTDLRGTHCVRPPLSFRQASTPEYILYHPSHLPHALTFLQSTSPLHSSQNPFSLHISTLHHPSLPKKISTVAPQNSFVVIPSGSFASKLITGDAESLRIDSPVPKVHTKTVAAQVTVTCLDCFCDDHIQVSDIQSADHAPLVVDSSTPDSNPLVPHNNSASSTASFYYHNKKSSRGHARYSADAYYSWARNSVTLVNKESDAFLMLYRDPPPWSLLESISTTIGDTSDRKQPKQSARHPIRKQNDSKQAALAALHKSATRKVITPQATPHPPPITLSRNPFRKPSSDIKAPLSHQHRITMPGASVKPLKPISAVKVPSLPRTQSSTSQLLPTKHEHVIKIRSQMNTVGDRGSSGSTDPAATKLKLHGATYLGPLKRSTSMGMGTLKKKRRFEV